MSRDWEQDDIRVFLTYEEIERILDLLDKANPPNAIDRRLGGTLFRLLRQNERLRGGTNTQQRPISYPVPKVVEEPGKLVEPMATTQRPKAKRKVMAPKSESSITEDPTNG